MSAETASIGGETGRRSSRFWPSSLLLLVAFALSLQPASAEAGWPGRNGAIVFVSAAGDAEEGIGANPNGIWRRSPGAHSRPLQLTAEAGDREPQVSPDGRLVVFSRQVTPATPGPLGRAIFTIHIDGSGLTQVTAGSYDTGPAFARSGRRIVFARSTPQEPGKGDLYSVGTDGAGLRRLTSGPAPDRAPAVSPRGNVVAFERRVGGGTHVFTMRPDGSRVRDATAGLPSRESAIGPDFSPSGARIAYVASFPGTPIYTMRPNGKDVRRLTAERNCSRCEIHSDPAYSPNGAALLVTASNRYGARLYAFGLRAGFHLRGNFGGVLEPVWQPLPAAR